MFVSLPSNCWAMLRSRSSRQSLWISKFAGCNLIATYCNSLDSLRSQQYRIADNSWWSLGSVAKLRRAASCTRNWIQIERFQCQYECREQFVAIHCILMCLIDFDWLQSVTSCAIQLAESHWEGAAVLFEVQSRWNGLRWLTCLTCTPPKQPFGFKYVLTHGAWKFRGIRLLICQSGYTLFFHCLNRYQ